MDPRPACLTETIRENLDKGEFSCDAVFSISKAFDSVDHKILLNAY